MTRAIQINHVIFRRKRRELGLTQSELAERSGASQSAISMFEAGRPDVLAEDKLRAIAETLGIDLAAAADTEAPDACFENKYCPTPDCPCNAPYLVSGQLCIYVTPVPAPVGEHTRCRLCGEVMESRCPGVECRAAVTHGAFCTRCGQPYVTPALPPGLSPEAFVHDGQARVHALMQRVHNAESLTRGKACPCPPSTIEGATPHVV